MNILHLLSSILDALLGTTGLLDGAASMFLETFLGKNVPQPLTQALSTLIVLSVALGIVEFAKKVLKYVVVAGWVLLVLRIALEVAT